MTIDTTKNEHIRMHYFTHISLQNQNIICLSRSNRALVAKTNYCIFVWIFGMFIAEKLV